MLFLLILLAFEAVFAHVVVSKCEFLPAVNEAVTFGNGSTPNLVVQIQYEAKQIGDDDQKPSFLQFALVSGHSPLLFQSHATTLRPGTHVTELDPSSDAWVPAVIRSDVNWELSSFVAHSENDRDEMAAALASGDASRYEQYRSGGAPREGRVAPRASSADDRDLSLALRRGRHRACGLPTSELPADAAAVDGVFGEADGPVFARTGLCVAQGGCEAVGGVLLQPSDSRLQCASEQQCCFVPWSQASESGNWADTESTDTVVQFEEPAVNVFGFGSVIHVRMRMLSAAAKSARLADVSVRLCQLTGWDRSRPLTNWDPTITQWCSDEPTRLLSLDPVTGDAVVRVALYGLDGALLFPYTLYGHAPFVLVVSDAAGAFADARSPQFYITEPSTADMTGFCTDKSRCAKLEGDGSMCPSGSETAVVVGCVVPFGVELDRYSANIVTDLRDSAQWMLNVGLDDPDFAGWDKWAAGGLGDAPSATELAMSAETVALIVGLSVGVLYCLVITVAVGLAVIKFRAGQTTRQAMTSRHRHHRSRSASGHMRRSRSITLM